MVIAPENITCPLLSIKPSKLFATMFLIIDSSGVFNIEIPPLPLFSMEFPDNFIGFSLLPRK